MRRAMKRILVSVLVVGAWACGARAQAVQTTVCAILKDPASFNGKTVTVQGTAEAGFDTFLLKDADCGLPVNALWLDYPPGSRAKAGPLALLELEPAHNFAGTYTAATRTPVTLTKDKEFKQFDSMLAQVHAKDPGLCLGCTRYAVTATVTGRLDGVADATLKRDPSGKVTGLGGFGNMNAYPARLVIASVSGVQGKEVDYSKADAEVKGDPIQYPNMVDTNNPLGAAQKFASLMTPDAGAKALQKDVEEYGRKGEDNGAMIGFGADNEATDPAQGSKDSPDGVIYDCIFNNLEHQLVGIQVLSLYHMGQHINDLRAATQDEVATLYTLENNAWVITVAGAARIGDRFLTLPGGELFLTPSWPPSDREEKMEDALTDFLSKGMGLQK
jgi:hypothetical protein